MIKGQRHQGNAHAQHEVLPKIGTGERPLKLLSQVLGANEGCDNDHEECKHGGLVEPNCHRRQRHRDLHRSQFLPLVRTRHIGGLRQFLGHAAQPLNGVPGQRNNREDQNGEDDRNIVDPEEHDGGNEIDEARECLRGIAEQENAF